MEAFWGFAQGGGGCCQLGNYFEHTEKRMFSTLSIMFSVTLNFRSKIWNQSGSIERTFGHYMESKFMYSPDHGVQAWKYFMFESTLHSNELSCVHTYFNLFIRVMLHLLEKVRTATRTRTFLKIDVQMQGSFFLVYRQLLIYVIMTMLLRALHAFSSSVLDLNVALIFSS